VLKKAGIIAATAAAGLLAVSPLAFAADDMNNDRRSGHSQESKSKKEEEEKKKNSEGLIKVENNNVSHPVQICAPEVNVPGDMHAYDLTGALALLSNGERQSQTDDVRVCLQESHAEQSIDQPIEQSVEN
jgi:hypothetical protein